MRKVTRYKCHECGKKFSTLTGWGNHMGAVHPGIIPKGWTDARYYYYLLTGKDHGSCVECGKETEWNESTMKYQRYCKNPACKQRYCKVAKGRMITTYGVEHKLGDADVQRKMLAKRKISGVYSFSDGTKVEYVGTYEKDFLQMLDTFLSLPGADIIGPSPHTYLYLYKNPNDVENEGMKQYIPDFFIPSLQLEVEIKQEGNQTKNILRIDKVKEACKDELMKTIPNVKYIKIVNKNYEEFFRLFFDLRDTIIPEEPLSTKGGTPK